MRLIVLTAYLTLFSFTSIAQQGYDITVEVDNYQEDRIYLAYYLGSKQYIADTLFRKTDNSFNTQGEEPLEPGLYILAMQPNNQTFELLIAGNEQKFTLKTNANDFVKEARFSGNALNNQLFYDYINFLNQARSKVQEIQKDTTDQNRNKVKLEEINLEVSAYQRSILNEHAETLTASLIKSGLPVEVPEFQGTDEEISQKGFEYTQNHFFDNTDLSDVRLLRTPILEQKIDYYLDRLTLQAPKYIIEGCKKIIALSEKQGKNYQFVVSHLLNKYAKSKVVGFDEVYVFLAETYYTPEKALWIDTEQLNKIRENAASIKPILIGKKAPNISLTQQDGFATNLHAIEANYSILYFHNTNCESCATTQAGLLTVAKEFKENGIKVISLCTNEPGNTDDCWSNSKVPNLTNWYAYSGGDQLERTLGTYLAQSQPLIYLLDQEKEIISKRIDPEHLSDLLNRLLNK